MSHNYFYRVMMMAIFIPVVVVSTGALFSDQESSLNNGLSAGQLDLQLNSTCTYNHEPCLKPPHPSNQHLIFDLQYLVPGDTGSASVSLQVPSSDAWLCGGLKSTSNSALTSVLLFTLWHDLNCSQTLDSSETIYQLSQPLISASWPLFDAATGTGPLSENQSSCLGLTWQLPTSVGNQLQTDSLNFDLSFTATQSRNQPQFTCLQSLPSPAISPTPTPTPTPTPNLDLFFSEYVEGTSNNKAVEIYNPSSGSVDLGGYQVQVFTNGSTTPTSINLSGMLASQTAYVVCHSSFVDPPRSTACQQNSGSLNFNGNDALALRQISVGLIDVIGVIGNNPVTEWGIGLISTADNTLVRSCFVTQGNPAGFIPVSVIASEWTGFAANTFSNLGSHSCP